MIVDALACSLYLIRLGGRCNADVPPGLVALRHGLGQNLCVDDAGNAFLLSLERRTLDGPDLDALLTTAPAETLRQAAALNYDDILYDQQL